MSWSFKRRTATLLILPLMAAGLLAGCGSSGSDSVSVSGSFGKNPSVQIPAQQPGNQLVVKTLVQGNGQQLGSNDLFAGNYAAYIWSGTTHRLAVSTFSQGQPAIFPPSSQLLKGLQKALIGQKVGSRVLAVVPPSQGYGPSANPQGGVKASDTLVFVVDVDKAYTAQSSASGQTVSNGGGSLPTVSSAQGGQAPSVHVPSGTAPPSSLTVQPLIRGQGQKITKGQTLVVQYVGLTWANNKTFDSSWSRGQPLAFQIGAQPSQVIPGWDSGLIGQTVGSRILLVIPPADGYGSKGNPQAGIKGTDTLVFAVDILGAYGPTQQ
jgi:FKBP-type peptidyl-prolyl cis-trans isomerase